MPGPLAWFVRLNPFQTPGAQRLALLFGIVYFAQGMWYLPKQTITVVLKDRGLSAGQVADFFLIATVPWLIKPLYGLVSDFLPLAGYRRKSYFLLTSALAAGAGFTLAATGLVRTGGLTTLSLTVPGWGPVPLTLVEGVGLFTVMAVGLAFTDVLTDAMMVETGRPLGLTGAFQSVQWACVTVAAVGVGLVGGQLAAGRRLEAAFALAACFPLVTMVLATVFLHERRARADLATFRATLGAIRGALRAPDAWVVAGFIFFWTFSPSFGPAFLFYQTDTLGFTQEFIGVLDALTAAANVAGALVYAPLSRVVRLKWSIVGSIGAGAAATLLFLAYHGPASAVGIHLVFGVVGMVAQLAFLDLAAKSCPGRVEATFFALFTGVFNAGSQLSENVGARLYDRLGFAPLVAISAGMTALAAALVPLVRIDRIEAAARAGGVERGAAGVGRDPTPGAPRSR